MKRQDFLKKLKKEEKLELVEGSEEICASYLSKSDESLKSAKILLDNGLLENSVALAYYSMYHITVALMRKAGIKCENHTGNMLLLKEAFQLPQLSSKLCDTKKERIDKQYYIDFEITRKETEGLIKATEDFVIELKLVIDELTPDKEARAKDYVQDL